MTTRRWDIRWRANGTGRPLFQKTFPDAEIVLCGVEEPACLIHAPNESVAPSEIEHLARAEALFLRRYGASSL